MSHHHSLDLCMSCVRGKTQLKMMFLFHLTLPTLTQTQTHRCPHTLGCSQQKSAVLKFPNLTHPWR